ncbi:hypothetical protein [Rhodococcus sp. KRD162]|jgi:hypothetical protein|uniref:hypothetical protein n=1 Tax=Rhodococcus sp. KRD162 TaxID=2729725 RepID=UPI0019D27A27|nr:hypothetical protein [Rhodococcus sp. KRD162]
MPLPTFTTISNTPAPSPTMTRTDAATKLGLSPTALDKLVHSGILDLPIPTERVSALADRPLLSVTSGELTVLRTDSPQPASDDDDRTVIGFHTSMENEEICDTSLRWWRCDPARVVDNKLLVVTIATIPVAALLVTAHIAQAPSGKRTVRHRFDGRLLARLQADGRVVQVSEVADLGRRVRDLMHSRIITISGGPIGYLGPNPERAQPRR